MDYSAIEDKVESDMVRSELEPVPGSYWISWIDGISVPRDGRCCILSPQILNVQGNYGEDILGLIIQKLNLPIHWVLGVTHGFDQGRIMFQDDEDYRAGWDFGQRMKDKYVN